MADVAFDGVFVPDAARLGEDAGADVQRIVDLSRVAFSAISADCRGRSSIRRSPTRKCGSCMARRSRRSRASRSKSPTCISLSRPCGGWGRAATEIDARKTATRNARLAQLYAANAAIVIADEGVQISADTASSAICHWRCGSATPDRFPCSTAWLAHEAWGAPDDQLRLHREGSRDPGGSARAGAARGSDTRATSSATKTRLLPDNYPEAEGTARHARAARGACRRDRAAPRSSTRCSIWRIGTAACRCAKPATRSATPCSRSPAPAEQYARWADKTIAIGLTEPIGGSDPASIRTTATWDAADERMGHRGREDLHHLCLRVATPCWCWRG